MTGIEFIAILALVGYALYRQTRVNEVTGRGRFKLAVIYTAAGVLTGVHIAHNPTAYGLLAIGLAASLAVGVLRGHHTRMWQTDERVFTQGTPATVGLFLGLVAFKFMVGVMLAVQTEVISRRARALRTARETSAEPRAAI